MDELKSWWDIAQLAGAGAAVVLGPIVVALWRKVQADTVYIRESDKNVLGVMRQVITMLEHGSQGSRDRHAAVIEAIANAVDHIKAHIDAAKQRRT